MKKEEKKVEEKVTTKDYSIEKKDQKRLKGISKFLYVIAKILKVFAIIGIVGIAIAMICIPIISANIKTEKKENANIIKVFDNDIYYRRGEHNFEIFKLDDNGNEIEKTEIKTQGDINTLNEVFDYLEKNDYTKITIYAEIVLALVIVALVIEIKIVNKVYDFFKNIYDKTTPFTEENVDLLNEIAKLSIIEFIVGIVISFVSALFINRGTTIPMTNIFTIVVLYAFIYIFKYGYKLQKETKGKIYS